MRKWSNPTSLNAGGGRLSYIEPFTGLRVVVLEGDGSNDDPIRSVTHYFDEAGFRVAVNDPCETAMFRADVDAFKFRPSEEGR